MTTRKAGVPRASLRTRSVRPESARPRSASGGRGPGAISKEEARELAREYLDLSHALGRYRFDRWADLSAAERKRIEREEWALLNLSSSLTTKAAGVVLDDLALDLESIKAATGLARQGVETIGETKDLLRLVASLVALGGAIVSQNPAAIGAAVADVWKSSGALAG